MIFRLNKKVLRVLFIVSFCVFLFYGNSPGQDRTMEIVRQVQLRTQKMYDNIEKLSFSGRSKTYVYFGWGALGMKMVPLLEEYYFDGIWTKPDTLQLIINAYRKVEPDTINTDALEDFPPPNPMQFRYDKSVTGIDRETYKDKQGNKRSVWPVFPFAMGADSLYDYRIVSEIGMNERRLIEIQVTPKYSHVPGVQGVFQVDVAEMDVVGSRYTFNEAAHFLKKEIEMEDDIPWYVRPIMKFEEDYKIKTKMALVNGVYWLPETMEEEVYVKIWGINVKMQRELEYTGYFINVKEEELPMVLHNPIPDDPEIRVLRNRQDGVTYDSVAVIFNRDSVLEKQVFEDSSGGHVFRMSEEEEKAIIESIEDKFSSFTLNNDIFDSETVAKNAMKMSLGQTSGKYVQFFQSLGEDLFLYNRVEGIRPFYNLNFTNILLYNSFVNLNVGYGFQDEKWKFGASMIKFFDQNNKFFAEGNIYDSISYNESNGNISTPKNTFTSLVLKEDYRDFYYTTGGNLGIGYKLTENLAFKVSGLIQEEKAAGKNASFGIFNWDTPFRINPEIDEGRLGAVRSSIIFRKHNLDVDISGEYTDTGFLDSDFSYQRVLANISYEFEPDYSNKFILTLKGGTSSGDLTPQKWFDIGGKVFLEYYGNLRGVPYKAYTGDRMAMGMLEYSYVHGNILDIDRENAEEWWYGWLKASKTTVWAGFGWSELSDSNRLHAAGRLIPALTADKTYTEFGLSIGDRFNFIRGDFIINNASNNKVLINFYFLR